MTTIEYRLKDYNDFVCNANWILKDLSTIKLGDILVDNTPIKKGITPLKEKQKKILKALKIPKITF